MKNFCSIEKYRVKTTFFAKKSTMILDVNDKCVIVSLKTALERHSSRSAGEWQEVWQEKQEVWQEVFFGFSCQKMASNQAWQE